MDIDKIIQEYKDKMEEGYQKSALTLLNGNWNRKVMKTKQGMHIFLAFCFENIFSYKIRMLTKFLNGRRKK